jgi:PAS domain S-box-containing protein
VLHPDDRARAFETWRGAVEGKGEYDLEYRVRRHDGVYEWFKVRGRAIRDASGRVARWFGAAVNVTDLKEAQERFQALADNIDQLAWMASGDGWIFWYNRRWYEYTGTTAEDMAGWGWQRVHDPEALPAVMERWTASIVSGQPFDMEFPLKGADGVFRPFLTRIQPIRGEDGKVAMWFGTNTDVSAQKEMEAELERRVIARTAELTEANAQLETFTYHVSHDLRGPLRTIGATSRILQEDYAGVLPGEAVALLTRQVEAANKLGQLIDDLLNLARLARAEIERTRVDLTELARELASEAIAQHPGTTVRVEVEEGLVAQADPRLLRLAVLNLIENAVKYSPHGGNVRVGRRGNGFFVSDEGIGIPHEYLERIFEPFERLHKDHEFRGTGIGLANVRQVVERHSGRVWAESAPGKGSTLVFTLQPS